MKATLKVKYSIWNEENGREEKLSQEREIEVTAMTDEDEIEPVLEEMYKEVTEKYPECEVNRTDWNSNQIFKIANSLM